LTPPTFYLDVPDFLDGRFCFHQLRQIGLNRFDSSTATPSLRRQDLDRQDFHFPDIVEQRRIVEVLEDHLSRLDAAKSYALMASRKTRTWRLAAVKLALPDNSRDRRPLDDLLVRSIGGVWGLPVGEDEIDVDVIRVTELRAGGRIDPSTAAVRSITRAQLASRQLQDGDLLLEKSGGGPRQPVGRVGIVDNLRTLSVCSNFMQLLRPNPEVVNPGTFTYISMIFASAVERRVYSRLPPTYVI